MPSTPNELPPDVTDEVERLTRLALDTVDQNEADAYRRKRDRILADYGYTARVRSEQTRDVLVCYPTDWIEDGAVRPERIEDLDRAVERPLGGVGENTVFEDVEATNRELVAAVEEDAGRIHAKNARAFADFMGNHYVRPMHAATDAEIREFLDEYYPRNVWGSAKERAVIEESLRVVFDVAGRSWPNVLDETDEEG